MAMEQLVSLKLPGDPRPRLSLYVGDLDPEVTEMNLRTVFSSMGPIRNVHLCRCSLTGRSLCYGYVNFYRPYDAYKALSNLNHTYLKGKLMRIMWCQRNPCARKSGIGNLYVKNLDASIDSAGLQSLFSKFGTILSCKVVEEHGKSKGYGFVQFDSEDSALAARTALHDTMLKEKKLYVSRFVKKSERTTATSYDELKFTNLYVKNLSKDMTQDAFHNMFSAFGEIISAVIMQDHNGKSRGFGFVDFESPEDAKKAVDALNGYQLESRTLFVGRAQAKAERKKILQHEYKDIFNTHMEKFKASNLYVKNLALCIDNDKLQELFSCSGKIVSAKVMRYDNGASRGFGFVCFSSPEEAKKALNALNGAVFQGKSLYVAMAQCKRDRQLALQTYFSVPQSQPPYLSDSSVVPPPISPVYYNFYPYSQQVPFLNRTFSYHNLGANMGFQHPYAAQSYHQHFSAYIPVAEMDQDSQKTTDQSFQMTAMKHATFNLSDQNMNHRHPGFQIIRYTKSSPNKVGAAGNNLKRLLATQKTSGNPKKVTGNVHPHVENFQPDLSGNNARMLSEIINSPSSSVLPAHRTAQVLKEVNILKKVADAGPAAMPKTANRCLNY
ncbi:polyadenylate-binding protein 4-like [Ricinus communis]|nr:polyadenylate-binding protein 4-like [Ricinus communis]